MNQAENLKGSAGQAFKDKMYEVAAGLFTQCLDIDPLNGTYNQTIYFNRASAYHNLGRHE